MNSLLILFYDPNFAIDIEDYLEEINIPYTILKTSESLLEIDPFYCKTMLETETTQDVIIRMRTERKLNIAAVYMYVDGCISPYMLEAI